MHRLISKLSLAAPLVAVSLRSRPALPSLRTPESPKLDTHRSRSPLDSSRLLAISRHPRNYLPYGILEQGKVNFPITSGVIDLDTASLQLLHSGGLTFKAASTEVTLSSFIIDDTASTPAISGLVTVDGKLLGRLTLFDLVWPKGIELPLKPVDNLDKLSGVSVNLDPGAASALNTVFKVTAFKGGFNIGTASVVAYVPTHTDEKLNHEVVRRKSKSRAVAL